MRRRKKSLKTYRNKDGRFFEKEQEFKKRMTILRILDNKKKFGKDFKHQHKGDQHEPNES